MITAAQSFRTLSASDVLKLFTLSDPTTRSTDQVGVVSTMVGASFLNAASSANAFQAVLVQAQVEKAAVEVSTSASTASATVVSAYMAQTQTDPPLATEIRAGSFRTALGSVQETGYDTLTSDPEASSEMDYGINSILTSPTAQTVLSEGSGKYTDQFHMSLTLGSASVAVDFALSGLDQLQTGFYGQIVAGNGYYTEALQLGLSTKDGPATGYCLNVAGLSAMQALQLGEQFNSAIAHLASKSLAAAGYSLSTMASGMPQQLSGTMLLPSSSAISN